MGIAPDAKEELCRRFENCELRTIMVAQGAAGPAFTQCCTAFAGGVHAAP